MKPPITFRSFCSGIGAPEQAWTPLGWRCLSTSEIDPQASAVLAHHHNVENLGDMTTARERITHERARLFVAGTPCQSFSVAGLRAGMADPRGNLALVFLGLVDAARPEWVVWENVPVVLSSNGGRDFGAFLGALGQLGYGWAYRILDAQYVRVESHARAVPQRRRRVFVVGHLGDWRRAAAVLFERGGLCGHPAPRREAGQGTAGTLGGGSSRRGWCDDTDRSTFVTHGVANAMQARDAKGVNTTLDVPLVAHSLRAEGHDASEDGTGRGVPIVPMQCNGGNVGTDLPSLRRGNGGLTGGVPAIAFQQSQSGVREYDSAGSIRARGPGTDPVGTLLRIHKCVRRLMPEECEAIQGFPRGYTQVMYKGKPMADAPRYRMLGNSMGVNVMSWIGQRIADVDAMGGPG